MLSLLSKEGQVQAARVFSEDTEEAQAQACAPKPKRPRLQRRKGTHTGLEPREAAGGTHQLL